MKSINEKVEEYALIAEGTDLKGVPYKDYNDYKMDGFEQGANYVLEQIENFMKGLDLGNSAEEKFYKLDILADIELFIEQLKK